MDIINKRTGAVVNTYDCRPRQLRELCMANIESLLRIALLDPDEHIANMGGEDHLITLMEKYERLAEKMLAWERRARHEQREGSDEA